MTVLLEWLIDLICTFANCIVKILGDGVQLTKLQMLEAHMSQR